MDLIKDTLVEKLNDIEISYILGPPKVVGTPKLKIRVGFVPRKIGTNSCGSIIIVPGRTEYIEKYAQILEHYTIKGFNCLIIDPRGQGLSDRLGNEYWHGDIDSFENAAIHLDLAIKKYDARLDGPRFILSHSMGGLFVALGMVNGLFGNLAGVIFSAPMWSLAPAAIGRALVYSLCASGLRNRTAPTFNVKWASEDFATNKVTTDKARFARNNALMLLEPRLQLGGPTNGWFYAAFNAFDALSEENLANIKTPCLVLQAGVETLVDNDGQSEIAARFDNCELVIIENGKHELLMERDEVRNNAIQIIDDFIAKNS
jgi:lysophospholipase